MQCHFMTFRRFGHEQWALLLTDVALGLCISCESVGYELQCDSLMPKNHMLFCTLQTRPLPLPYNGVRKVVEPDWDQPTETISQYDITTLSNFYSFRRQVFAAPSGHYGNLKVKSQKSCGARVHERYDW